jgi:hypothetical protein
MAGKKLRCLQRKRNLDCIEYMKLSLQERKSQPDTESK